jgi:CheY-like chemotaxis protein
VVEDDERVRLLACTILRRYGYRVLDAQSGGDALIVCEQHEGPIDLLLTDVVMPRMSGPQLASRLASALPEMKVLFVSGHMTRAKIHHGPEGSQADVLQKPITPEVLARKVRDVLGNVQDAALTR